jgi:hypothetical protein
MAAFEKATDALESGAALEKLELLRAATNASSLEANA